MAIRSATAKQILDELSGLEPELWFEVLDFIGYLKQFSAEVVGEAHSRVLTARDLLQSGLVGLWADRQDLGDSVAFARRIRQVAEHRAGLDYDPG